MSETTKFNRYIVKVAEYLDDNYPHMRVGQAHMNVLFEFDKELYVSITGTEYDCFYDDRKLDAFITYICDNMK